MTIKTTEKNGPVIGTFQLVGGEDLILITTRGKIIRIGTEEIPIYSRGTQGVKLIDLESGERVAAASKFVERNSG